jgi:hypothetical protein
MERPMKVYGLNLIEQFVTDLLTALSWGLILFSVAAALFPRAFFAVGFLEGMLVAATALTGALLMLGSVGIRQNRSAVDAGGLLLAVLGLVWLIVGLTTARLGSGLAGLAMLALFGLTAYLRRLAVQARFKPRFLSLREFETMVQVADTMIEGDGEEALHPIEVAIHVDHFLHEIDSPLRADIKGVLFVVEWLLPLLILRPIRFSNLGSNQRRRAVEKVIGAGRPFRDVARGLKLLASAGYYGSPAGMRQAGYIPFEARRRSQGVDQSPRHYPDPHPPGGF